MRATRRAWRRIAQPTFARAAIPWPAIAATQRFEAQGDAPPVGWRQSAHSTVLSSTGFRHRLAVRVLNAQDGSGFGRIEFEIAQGVFAMKTIQSVSLAVAAAIVGALAWWELGPTPRETNVGLAPRDSSATSQASLELDATVTADPSQPELVAGARVSVPAQAVQAPVLGTPVPPSIERLAFVDARFVDKLGTPWSGVRLAPLAPSWMPTWNPGEGALSEADGRVRLQIALPARRDEFGALRREVKLEVLASKTGCTSVARSVALREGETSHLGFIVLGPGLRIEGRVVDAQDQGLAQARLGIAPALLEGDEGQLARHGAPSFLSTPGTTSAADGAFILDGAPPGKLRVWARLKGYRFAWSEPIDAPEGRDVQGITLKLSPLLATDRIAGQVVDPDGAPIARVALRTLEHWRGAGNGSSIACDKEGRFEIIVQHDDSTYDFSAEDMLGRFAAQTVTGITPGSLDVVIRLIAREQMAVRVLDAQGAVVNDAKFDVMSQGSSMDFVSTRTADGAYSMARPGEPFMLMVVASGFKQSRLGRPREMLDPMHLPSELVIVLQRAKLLRGRVTAEGAPVAGARVHITTDHPEGWNTVNGYRSRYIAYPWMHVEVFTDADGRYQLDCETKSGYDVDKGFWLRAMAEGWAATEVGPVAAAQLEPITVFDIELTRGGSIEGRVLLPDGRDGEGSIVALNHGDGFPMTIRAGKDGAFRMDGLTVGKWQVLPATGEIDPDRLAFNGEKFDGPIEWSCEVSAGVTTHFDLDLTKQ